jgi:hypothetical protein
MQMLMGQPDAPATETALIERLLLDACRFKKSVRR